MIKSKRLTGVVLVLSLGGIPLLVSGQDSLKVQNYEGVPYVTGGVGLDEREALAAMRRDFNLQLTFAVKSGNYLSNVQVDILDPQGKTVLETTTEGPLLYARLKPGGYTVRASALGRNSRKNVEVPSRGQARLNFYWP